MGNDLIDQRLHAARPADARPDETAYDAALLARVREQPIAAASGRSVPRAVAIPVVAGVTLTAAAAYMLASRPGDVAGPGSSAAAITQTLRWLTPPPDTVLHTKAIEVQGGRTTTHEWWQSSDDPQQAREREETPGEPAFEQSGDGAYDEATNTIRLAPIDSGAPGSKQSGVAGTKDSGWMPAPLRETVSDPMVTKVRVLLEEGDMTVSRHTEKVGGVDAWEISLKPGLERKPWTMWVDARNGKPLKLQDPGRDASEAPQVVRWSTYEFLPDENVEALTTLTGAHPGAHIVRDGERPQP
jgi:hypothetical protein